MSDASPDEKPIVFQTDEQRTAAEKRAAAANAAPVDDRIDALLWERKGYVVRGLDSRVADVDAALAALGYTTESAAAPAAETAAAPKPRARKTN